MSMPGIETSPIANHFTGRGIPAIVYYYYYFIIIIILYITLDLGLNTRLMSGIQLRQMIPTNWNASSRGLRPSVLIVSFLKSITAILLLWSN
jgi:hypothetical protein